MPTPACAATEALERPCSCSFANAGSVVLLLMSAMPIMAIRENIFVFIVWYTQSIFFM